MPNVLVVKDCVPVLVGHWDVQSDDSNTYAPEAYALEAYAPMAYFMFMARYTKTRPTVIDAYPMY